MGTEAVRFLVLWMAGWVTKIIELDEAAGLDETADQSDLAHHAGFERCKGHDDEQEDAHVRAHAVIRDSRANEGGGWP